MFHLRVDVDHGGCTFDGRVDVVFVRRLLHFRLILLRERNTLLTVLHRRSPNRQDMKFLSRNGELRHVKKFTRAGYDCELQSVDVPFQTSALLDSSCSMQGSTSAAQIMDA